MLSVPWTGQEERHAIALSSLGREADTTVPAASKSVKAEAAVNLHESSPRWEDMGIGLPTTV